jgi:hypothetical protein
MATQIFVNLPVKDLKRSMDFFSALGYTFNPQFTNDKAASMIISDTIYAMLLTEPMFGGFTKKEIADAKKTTEVIIALSFDSREEVDSMVKKAVAAGGKTYADPMDHGFMYQHGFEDPDGHLWEVFWMNMSQVPEHMPA